MSVEFSLTAKATKYPSARESIAAKPVMSRPRIRGVFSRGRFIDLKLSFDDRRAGV